MQMRPGGTDKEYQSAINEGLTSFDRLGIALEEVGRNLDRDVETNKPPGAMPKSLTETSSLKRKSVDRSDGLVNMSVVPAETSYVLFFQVLFPFLIAGLGMVFAGLVLSVVVTWPLFEEVPEILILVPALLGLKGNLEMTLASRLSTLANLGHLDSDKQKFDIIVANMSLVQLQAIVVAFLASAFAAFLSWIQSGKFDMGHVTLMCASSLATASIASFVLSLVMIFVIIMARKYNVNPDNVATPIAASLGDLTTLSVLAFFGNMFLHGHKNESLFNPIVIIVFMCFIPLYYKLASTHEGCKETLRNGWTPVIMSMLISSGGGFILENAVRKYKSLSTFGPVLNGVGGNLAAVQASRLSTYFHQGGTQLGELPNGWLVSRFYSIKRAFFSKEWDSRSARVLLLLVVPGHICFNLLIQVFTITNTTTKPPSGPLFTSLYMFAAMIQVMILLFICQILVALLWKWKVDPDNSVIPYLTALGDLLGTLLLYIVFLTTDKFDPKEITAS